MSQLAMHGVEVDLNSLERWTPSVQQVRDAVLSFRVVGATFGAEDWTGNAALYQPTQREVEVTIDMAADAIRAGRVIDFGMLPNAMIKEGGNRGGPLYEQGALGLPFREPWMLLHAWEGGQAIYLVNLLDRDKPAGGDVEVCELEAIVIDGNRVLSIGDRAMFTPDPDDPMPSYKYRANAAPSPFRFLRGLEAMNNGARPENAAVGNVLDPLMAALLLLSTDGVPRRTVLPDAKLARARMKSGKPPIPSYDVVDAGPYVTALLSRRSGKRDSQGGTHASPVPHLRRGHYRQLASGVKSFVRDCLINATDEARANFRSHYTTKG